jgi:uncharacterized protein DUF6152
MVCPTTIKAEMNRIVAGLVAVVLAHVPLWAHHSAAAEYDASKLLVLDGVVTKVEWSNPHVYFHIGVKDRSGALVDWYLEAASPNGMRRQGWLPKTMKPGDRVTVEAYKAKDAPSLAKTHRVKVPDGRWLFADSTGPDQLSP